MYIQEEEGEAEETEEEGEEFMDLKVKKEMKTKRVCRSKELGIRFTLRFKHWGAHRKPLLSRRYQCQYVSPNSEKREGERIIVGASFKILRKLNSPFIIFFFFFFLFFYKILFPKNLR